MFGQLSKISIVIKALNEAAHIEAAIRSALLAVSPFRGEVILADSISTDGTVEIAQRFPVTITQLLHSADRRCGAGPQLGFQIAAGEFIYILDGDMELDPDFLPAAMAAMAQDPQLAGIAGLVEEESGGSYQFRGRQRRHREMEPGSPAWLDMGGLYRASAVRAVGYFSDRNLHSYEEMDLGLRLISAGWRLRRLPVRSVLHHGRREGNWALLLQRWQSRYLDGAGEILRAAWGNPHFTQAARSQRHLFVGIAIWLGAIVGVLTLPVSAWCLMLTLLITGVLILWRAFRIGSLMDSCFAQVVWQMTALAMLRGILRKPVDPRSPLGNIIIARGGLAGRLPE